MNKIYIKILNIFLIFFLAWACEKNIELKRQPNASRLIVNALANPDTVLIIYIYKSVDITQNPDLPSPASSSVKVDNATVEVIVNGNRFITARYNKENNSYTSEYIPSPGDRIEIRAQAGNLQAVQTSSPVPAPSRYNIVSHFKYYNKNELIYHPDGVPNPYYAPKDFYGADTCMSITCKIQDNGNEKNFYRLSVKSIAKNTVGVPPYELISYYDQPLYTSDNPIFLDPDITCSIQDRPVYFSCVFDDTLFNGQDYEFTVHSRQRNIAGTWYEIDLQSISEDFYKYLKSVEKYNCSENDIFTEAVPIHSNVAGGAGIFGGLTSHIQMIHD